MRPNARGEAWRVEHMEQSQNPASASSTLVRGHCPTSGDETKYLLPLNCRNCVLMALVSVRCLTASVTGLITCACSWHRNTSLHAPAVVGGGTRKLKPSRGFNSSRTPIQVRAAPPELNVPDGLDALVMTPNDQPHRCRDDGLQSANKT